VPAPTYKFGDFELDSSRYELRRSGRALKLERIPMELLILLLEKNGQVITSGCRRHGTPAELESTGAFVLGSTLGGSVFWLFAVMGATSSSRLPTCRDNIFLYGMGFDDHPRRGDDGAPPSERCSANSRMHHMQCRDPELCLPCSQSIFTFTGIRIVRWNRLAGNGNFAGGRQCPRGLRGPALQVQ